MDAHRLVQVHAGLEETKQGLLVTQLREDVERAQYIYEKESLRLKAMEELRKSNYKACFGIGRGTVVQFFESGIAHHLETQVSIGKLGAVWVKVEAPEYEMEELDERASLYLISGGGLTKIGVSRNVDQRLKALQASSPEILTILGSRRYEHSRDAYSTESELHARFKDRRGHGEWFDLTDGDINTILVEYNFTQNDT